MNIAIIQYNGGNTQSVAFALERIGVKPIITADAGTIMAADKVIFPGVGAAGAAMDYLKATGLDVVIKNLQQPVLGICLGMQLMCAFSEEGNIDCLNIISECVVRFNDQEKVPHMGWNEVCDLKSPLFSDVDKDSYMYFVHSYYVPANSNAIATTNYQTSFSAAIQKDNFYAVQFHPEKSGVAGERVLQNFLAL